MSEDVKYLIYLITFFGYYYFFLILFVRHTRFKL